MKSKRPKYHVFNGKRYKIVWRSAVSKEKERGRCDDPTNAADSRCLFVSTTQEPKEVSDTIIHEALHAELWLLDEATVTRVAKNINDFLWKCGFELKPVKKRPSRTSR